MIPQKSMEDKIHKWFKDRGLGIDDSFIEKAGIYQDLILEWFDRINLVSKNDLGNLLERHILDSLTPIKEIPETGSMVDTGSGAGFPAVPIALVRPALDIVMIESIRKKVIFLDEAIERLHLTNVSIWHGRLEDFPSEKEYDVATIRAVAINKKIEKNLRRIVKINGKIIYYNKFNNYKLLLDT